MCDQTLCYLIESDGTILMISITTRFVSFLKFSIVLGAASFQNCTTISPSLVLMTATSLDAFIGGFSLFSSAAKSAELSNSATAKIDNFILTSATKRRCCHGEL